MRFLDQAAKQAVQAVINQNVEQLKRVPGFVSAEPGFPTPFLIHSMHSTTPAFFSLPRRGTLPTMERANQTTIWYRTILPTLTPRT